MDQEQAGAPALAAFTEAQRQQAMARFAVLRSHLHEGIPLSEGRSRLWMAPSQNLLGKSLTRYAGETLECVFFVLHLLNVGPK